MNYLQILLILIAGVASGFINTIAGGGSSITLPLLMFLGLSPNMANGTNRIAILMQSIVGVGTFRKNKVMTFREGWKLALPSAAGALAGALVAVDVNEELMKWLVIAVMSGVLLLVIFKPEVWIKDHAQSARAQNKYLQMFIFFLIGFYGGFIQVGVGFLLLAGLVLGCGHNLVKGNALKVLIVLVYTVIALVIFLANSQANIGIGLILGAGSMLGAWLGAKFTIKGGAVYVRYFLIVALVAMILKLAGIF
jgi:uncharacterized membrane protein YfcA